MSLENMTDGFIYGLKMNLSKIISLNTILRKHIVKKYKIGGNKYVLFKI